MAALPAAPAGDGKDVTSSVGNASAVMSFKLLGLELQLGGSSSLEMFQTPTYC